MIWAWPVVVVGPPELPELAPPRTAAPIALIVTVLMIGLAVAQALALAALIYGWVGEDVARWLSLNFTSGGLYADPELFRPSQLWTAAVLHPPMFGDWRGLITGLWALFVDVSVLLVIGRAWERVCGSAAFLGFLLVAMPTVGLIHLRHTDQIVPFSTVGPFIACLLAALAAILPGRRLRIRFVYWIMVAVGTGPIHLDLRWIAVLYVVQEALRSFLTEPSGVAEHGLALIAALVIGTMLGSVAKPLARR